MGSNTKPVLCGECHSLVKIAAYPKPKDMVTCSCGNADTFENVMEIVGEHTQEHAAGMFQKSTERVVRDSKAMKFSGLSIVKKHHRFYIDLEH